MDVGSISTKGVILDKRGRLISQAYLWTEGNPLDAVKRLLKELKRKAPGSEPHIRALGTTGSARRLAGAMLDANAVKNEITAHAMGTLSRHPEARTILEIGGQDSKIILIKDGLVSDYAMNTLCAAGTGAFLSAQAKRLGLSVEELGAIALKSASPARLSARCTVFAETDLIHKAQAGYSKEDLVAGLCLAVAVNYLANVGKGKKITPPVIFQGGVSKNQGVVAAFKRELDTSVLVEADGHLMGAIGAAILAAKAPQRTEPFRFDIAEKRCETRTETCSNCQNHCELVRFYRGDNLLDYWGNRCENVSADRLA